ncbi:gamma carbonic anhydrase family protein [Novosphingobium piscinae]|uniref:Gamma carbonic anhydrase family protein n=1 Tax=Novosphingobium piscinae TaxID=1507448 RepID=A0A7X1G1C5_9SPHN|nr:gamma carbonic anhydrase family protein [Novosphingobium piscinae]MBC2670865.1 gamma carbonic anhydrase family protein [Novosphingobium piscinae]
MTDRPDVTILPFAGKVPRIADSAFIAPGCRIIGDVEIGADASIWYNCVIRGDVNRVVIGARTNVQDGTVIHCDSPEPRRPEGFPTLIGADVLIGHMAMIHGCTLADRAFVGLGAIVMSGAAIDCDGMLAAGALLTPGKRIGPRQLWGGRPAAPMRDLTDAALADMREGVSHYVENGRRHAAEIAAVLGPAQA